MYPMLVVAPVGGESDDATNSNIIKDDGFIAALRGNLRVQGHEDQHVRLAQLRDALQKAGQFFPIVFPWRGTELNLGKFEVEALNIYSDRAWVEEVPAYIYTLRQSLAEAKLLLQEPREVPTAGLVAAYEPSEARIFSELFLHTTSNAVDALAHDLGVGAPEGKHPKTVIDYKEFPRLPGQPRLVGISVSIDGTARRILTLPMEDGVMPSREAYKYFRAEEEALKNALVVIDILEREHAETLRQVQEHNRGVLF